MLTTLCWEEVEQVSLGVNTPKLFVIGLWRRRVCRFPFTEELQQRQILNVRYDSLLKT